MSNVQINSVELNDNLRLPGLKGLADYAGSTRYLLGGGIVDQTIPINNGQELVLTSSLDGNELHGYFTGAQVDAIKALKASRETVVFKHHTGEWNVRVIAIDVDPVFKYKSAPAATDRYVGTVTMIIK